MELGIFSIIRNREAPSLSGTGKILLYWELLDSFPIGYWQDPFIFSYSELGSTFSIGNWDAPSHWAPGTSFPTGNKFLSGTRKLLPFWKLRSSVRNGNYNWILSVSSLDCTYKLYNVSPRLASKCQRHMSVINGSVADV